MEKILQLIKESRFPEAKAILLDIIRSKPEELESIIDSLLECIHKPSSRYPKYLDEFVEYDAELEYPDIFSDIYTEKFIKTVRLKLHRIEDNDKQFDAWRDSTQKILKKKFRKD